MGELFWPGEDRAGEVFSEASFLAAMVEVESAWVGRSLTASEVALVAEPGGNPVIALVDALRRANPEVAEQIHSGLTSQDVLDTALVMMLRDAVGVVGGAVARQLAALDRLREKHGHTPMIGRTLTQPALTMTFAHKVDTWTAGVRAARVDLDGLSFPVQCGGPVGLGVDGHAGLAERLGLEEAVPWHTERRTITRAGDALVALTDAWGRIARDVLELSRPEIGELSEGTGGGSSSIPDKHNPVLSVLVRRAALAAPMLAATLHLAAAEQVDERADGAWHVEWDTLRILVRRTVVAALQAAELLEQLQVHDDRMRART